MDFADDTLNYIRDNVRTMLAVVVIALLLVGYLIFGFTVILPQWQYRADLLRRQDIAESALDQRAQTSQQVPDALRSDIEAAQAALDSAAAQFLTESQAALVLDNLYLYAAGSGVEIVDLQAQQTPETGPKSVYDVRLFRVQVEGKLPALVDFMGRMRETAVSTVNLTNLSLTAGETMDHLTFDLSLYTSPYANETALTDLPVVPTPLPVPTAVPTQPPTADLLAEQLHQPWQDEDWATAIGIIQEILAIDPSYPEMTEKLYAAYVNDGFRLQAQGDEDGARLQFEQALVVNPNGVEARLALSALDGTLQAVTTTYVVRGGDTLFSIARQHGVTVDALRAANGLVDNAISPGQELIIP